MTTYKFIYESDNYEDRGDSPFPSGTEIEVRHEFDDDQTWHGILWQFCRFLEHIGFESVRKSVRIDQETSPYLFERFFTEPVQVQQDLEDYIASLNKDEEE